MKILVIPYIIPYPPDNGGKICVFSFINNLKDKINFTVFFELRNIEDENAVCHLKTIWPEVDIQVVKAFNEQSYSSVSESGNNIYKKSLKFLKIFKGKNPKIKTENITEANYNLAEDVGRTTPFLPKSKKYIDALQSVIANKVFNLIQIELTENLNLVNALPENIKKIYVEIESRYSVIRDFANSKNTQESYDQYIVNNTKAIELAMLKKYDVIFALSDKDASRLKEIFPEKKIYVSPFSIDDSNVRTLDINEFSINKIVFLGPEIHFPNSDGLNWFIEEVMKKEDINLQLYVIGKWSEKTRLKFAVNPQVIFTGYVDDLSPYLKNSISIIPIRIGGGGLRTKILMAMAQGSLIISTTLGFDGFKLNNEETFLLADNATDFYNQIKFAENNTKETFKIVKNAQTLFLSKYSQSSSCKIRYELYFEIFNS